MDDMRSGSDPDWEACHLAMDATPPAWARSRGRQASGPPSATLCARFIDAAGTRKCLPLAASEAILIINATGVNVHCNIQDPTSRVQ